MKLSVLKRIFKSSCAIDVKVSATNDADAWVSNGHWAMRRSACPETVNVTREALAVMVGAVNGASELADGSWRNVLPKFSERAMAVKFTRTPFVIAGKGREPDLAVFRSEDGRGLLLKRDYADAFEVDTVYSERGASDECVADAIPNDKSGETYRVVVMPARHDNAHAAALGLRFVTGREMDPDWDAMVAAAKRDGEAFRAAAKSAADFHPVHALNAYEAQRKAAGLPERDAATEGGAA